MRVDPAAIAVCIEASRKRAFASALDWPGWCRSGRDEAGALAALAAAAPRYAVVPAVGGIPFPDPGAVSFRVLERVAGNTTTDFGAPAVAAAVEAEPLSAADAERLATLVAAAWVVFDRVVGDAPSALRKGPRGGGRDRDQVGEHVLAAETAYARKLGLRLRQPPLDDQAGIAAHREAILNALRGAAGPTETRGWPPRYAARRIAWHVMDHAWEIEDRSP